MANLGLKARIFAGEEREVEERLNEFLADPAVAVEDVRLGYQARHSERCNNAGRLQELWSDRVAVVVLYRKVRRPAPVEEHAYIPDPSIGIGCAICGQRLDAHSEEAADGR